MPKLGHASKHLIPQRVERADGVGPAVEVGECGGKLLVVTLGINEVVEQEGLSISIWGSSSGTDWGPRPLVVLPQKSYCGVYATFLNLKNNPSVRFLRVEWKMSSWAHRDSDLLFGFYVSMSDSLSRVQTAVA